MKKKGNFYRHEKVSI